MELLKSNPIIDKKYIPSTKMDHISYFNRALNFAQTNYQDHLVKITKLDGRNITAANFFEEYAGVLIRLKSPDRRDAAYFIKLFMHLSHYTKSFWNLNNFPKQEIMAEELAGLDLDDKQLEHLHTTARIINQGIKLFGWADYRNKFLNSTSKLVVLPGLGLKGGAKLSQDIGNTYCPNEIQELYDLSHKLGFEDAETLCKAIQKNFPMSSRTVGAILLYSAVTFPDA